MWFRHLEPDRRIKAEIGVSSMLKPSGRAPWRAAVVLAIASLTAAPCPSQEARPAERTPLCVTLAPARDPGELRTVLLIGELGDAANDPPVKVLIVDDLLSDGRTGRPVSFRGMETHVIPLEAGPTLVLAEVVPEDEWSMSGRGSACPAGARQVVRVTWAGGVRLPNGGDPGDAERVLYRVTVERPDGTRDETAPAALAELGDNDNNHLLCLDTADPAVSVAVPAGHLVDPNRDLNPETQVAVTAVPRP